MKCSEGGRIFWLAGIPFQLEKFGVQFQPGREERGD